MSGYLINFCGVVHMPRLGPSCLVLFLPRMLLHPYIHLAGNVVRDDDTSRGASRTGKGIVCAERCLLISILYRSRIITPRSFYSPNPNTLTTPIIHLSTGATSNHPHQESWNEPKIDCQYDHSSGHSFVWINTYPSSNVSRARISDRTRVIQSNPAVLL
jgi:hypothetical protein